MFKGIANIASLMKQAQQMGGKMQELGEELKAQRVTGSAGGGMVEVELNGAGEMLRLQIDPSLIANGDGEMIEDLVPAAVNQAQMKAKQLHAEAMQRMTGDMPGLEEALSQFTGAPPLDTNDG